MLEEFISKNENCVTIQKFYVDTVEDMSVILDAINTTEMFVFIEINSNYNPVYFYGGKKANRVLTFIMTRDKLNCNLKVSVLHDEQDNN